LFDFTTEGVWDGTRSLVDLHENSFYKFGLMAFLGQQYRLASQIALILHHWHLILLLEFLVFIYHLCWILEESLMHCLNINTWSIKLN